MGIASADLTGDGYPEVYLTSQGDNKLQTLADGPAQPAYEDIALERGATAHRPFTGGDVLPSTAWHAEFADVNNDGFLDLFVAKGNVEAQTEYAMRDPNNLLIGQADGTFVEGAEDAGHRQLPPGARRGASSTSTSTGCSTSSSSTASNRWRCGATSAPATPTRRTDGRAGSPCGCASRRQRRRHRRLGGGARRRPHADPRGHRRRRPRRRAARLAALRPRRRRRRRGAGAVARR